MCLEYVLAVGLLPCACWAVPATPWDRSPQTHTQPGCALGDTKKKNKIKSWENGVSGSATSSELQQIQVIYSGGMGAARYHSTLAYCRDVRPFSFITLLYYYSVFTFITIIHKASALDVGVGEFSTRCSVFFFSVVPENGNEAIEKNISRAGHDNIFRKPSQRG